MKSVDPNKVIVFDSDVIIHFIKSGFITSIKDLYPKNKKIILGKLLSSDGVLLGKHANEFQNLMRFKLFEIVDFPEKGEIIKEYANLTSNLKLGKGESACLAFAKYTSNIVASSNLKDIQNYCIENKIDYLTTMDFLEYAHQNKILSEADCDYFIYNVKSKDSRLPYNSMKEYYSNQP